MYREINKYSILLFLGLILGVISSCGGSSGEDDIVFDNTPTNLVIEAAIFGKDNANPNGDGSGKVTFNFSADNANLYKLSLGDDSPLIETSNNSYTHTYVGAGTKTYSIFISAYNNEKVTSKSISVTVKINSSILWADEFNYTGSPDSSKWNYDLGNGDWGWGNNEDQYYTDRSENVIVEDGLLKITAKKENYQGFEYTSARLKTQGKFDFTYGKVEVKAKLPQGVGTWPAIWMLGSDFHSNTWPACGEIDIMEHVGYQQGYIHSSLHTTSSSGATVNTDSKYLSDVSTAFHVYGVEWTSEKIVFTIDGITHYTYNPGSKNSANWPFDSDQFIILNIAMGGTWGGVNGIDPNFTESSMEIDYIRVYQ